MTRRIALLLVLVCAGCGTPTCEEMADKAVSNDILPSRERQQIVDLCEYGEFPADLRSCIARADRDDDAAQCVLSADFKTIAANYSRNAPKSAKSKPMKFVPGLPAEAPPPEVLPAEAPPEVPAEAPNSDATSPDSAL